MRNLAAGLLISTVVAAIAYFTIGGLLLGIVFGTLLLTTLIVSIFSLGIWYAHKSISLGVNLAITAQTHNDQWDAHKLQSFSRFGSEMVKLARANQNGAGLPMLPDDDEIINGFLMNGFDEEDL